MGAQAHCRRAAPCPALSARCWCGDFCRARACSSPRRGAWVGGVARARPLLRGSLSQRGGSRAPGSASVARPRSPGAELDPGRPRAPRAPGLASTRLTDRAGWLGLVLLLGRNAPSPAKTLARLPRTKSKFVPRPFHATSLASPVPSRHARARAARRSVGERDPATNAPRQSDARPAAAHSPACTIQRSIDRARCRARLAGCGRGGLAHRLGPRHGTTWMAPTPVPSIQPVSGALPGWCARANELTAE